MEMIQIANTDIEVSSLCLGSAHWGTKISEGEADQVLDAYLENGGNFIDTALLYGTTNELTAESEKIIGRLLAKKNVREEFVIATKGLHTSTLGLKQLTNDINQSLENLQTSYIDIYLLHKDHKSFKIEDIIDLLISAKIDGKIRHFGFSNWSQQRLQNAYSYCLEKYDYKIPVVELLANALVPNTSFFNPKEVVILDDSYDAYLQEKQITCLCYSALSSGYLTKSNNGKPTSNSFLNKSYYNYNTRVIVKHLQNLAVKYNCHINSVALKYLNNKKLKCIPIIGVNNSNQLLNTLTCSRQIEQREMTMIDLLKKREPTLLDKLTNRI